MEWVAAVCLLQRPVVQQERKCLLVRADRLPVVPVQVPPVPLHDLREVAPLRAHEHLARHTQAVVQGGQPRREPLQPAGTRGGELR
jgi:hypothetical protein